MRSRKRKKALVERMTLPWQHWTMKYIVYKQTIFLWVQHIEKSDNDWPIDFIKHARDFRLDSYVAQYVRKFVLNRKLGKSTITMIQRKRNKYLPASDPIVCRINLLLKLSVIGFVLALKLRRKYACILLNNWPHSCHWPMKRNNILHNISNYCVWFSCGVKIFWLSKNVGSFETS